MAYGYPNLWLLANLLLSLGCGRGWSFCFSVGSDIRFQLKKIVSHSLCRCHDDVGGGNQQDSHRIPIDSNKDEDCQTRPPTVKLISLDVDSQHLQEFLHKVHQDEMIPPSFLVDVPVSGGPNGTWVERTHVTLAFPANENWAKKESASLQAYMPLLQRVITDGDVFVPISIHSLLWNNHVAAWNVTVSSSNLVSSQRSTTSSECRIPPPRNEFVHITIWVAKNSRASWANDLPNDPSTQRLNISSQHSPMVVMGRFSLWGVDNECFTKSQLEQIHLQYCNDDETSE